MFRLDLVKRPFIVAASIAALSCFVPPVWGDPVVLYDNGSVLDDWGDPASQLSYGWSPWRFIAAAADDFVLPALGSPETNYQITEVRAPFVFWGEGTGNETPAYWQGIHVTVYASSATDQPQGQPDINGGHSECVTSQYVPVAALDYTTTGQYRTAFVVDIPVNIMLAQNRRYWLSLVPQYPAPPQTFWCLSSVAQTGFHARRGSSFDVPFWSEIEGNLGDTPGAPPAGSHKDLAFQLLGVPEPATAACLLLFGGLLAGRRKL